MRTLNRALPTRADLPQRKPLPGRKPLPDKPGAVKAAIADPIEAAQEVITAAQQAFREKNKREQERFLDVTDSEYWCAVCFRTREQKEAFLEAMKLLDQADKYIDGIALARQLQLALPSDDLTHKQRAASAALLALVRGK